MGFEDYGISIHRNGQGIETVSLKGLELSLVGSGDGTEVIHHRLKKDVRWAIEPQEDWNALEYFYLLRGVLRWVRPEGDVVLQVGDSVVASPILQHSVFIAEAECEFLYVSSKPVFHYYSKVVKELMDLNVAVEQKDGYTADHCQRIMKLSLMVGEYMSLPSNALYELNLGSFFHDLGKVRIPQSILGKPSSLSKEEWEIMKKHTIYGRHMLEETNLPYLKTAAHIVEQHHERYNGTGYPYGLNGNEISMGGAIVAVVDSFDAMTTDRVYQKGRSKDEALSEIRKWRERLYHPDVVDAFIALSD